MPGASAAVVPGFLYSLAINATVTLGSVATAVQAASVATPTPNPAPSSPSAPSTSSASAIAPGFLDSPIFNITVTPGAFAPITTAQGATKATPAPVAQAPALPYASSSSTASASNTRQPGFIDSPPFSSTATLGSIRTTFNSGGATSSTGAGAASRSSSSRRTSSSRASGSGGIAPTSASSVEAGPFRSPSSPHTGAPSSSSSSSSSSGLAQISAQSATSRTSTSSVAPTTPSIVVVPTPGSSVARESGAPTPSSPSSSSPVGSTSTNHTDMVGLAIGLTCVLVLGVLATTLFVCRRFRSRRSRTRGGAGLLLQGEDAMGDDAYSPIARRRDSAGSARSRVSIGSGMGMEVGAHYDTDTWAAPTAWSEESGAGSRSQGPFYALREPPTSPFDFPPASPPPASPPAARTRPRPVISAKGFMRRIRGGQASRGLMTTLAPVPESLSSLSSPSPAPVPPQMTQVMREISRPLPTHNEGGGSRPWIHRTRTISES